MNPMGWRKSLVAALIVFGCGTLISGLIGTGFAICMVIKGSQWEAVIVGLWVGAALALPMVVLIVARTSTIMLWVGTALFIPTLLLTSYCVPARGGVALFWLLCSTLAAGSIVKKPLISLVLGIAGGFGYLGLCHCGLYQGSDDIFVFYPYAICVVAVNLALTQWIVCPKADPVIEGILGYVDKRLSGNTQKVLCAAGGLIVLVALAAAIMYVFHPYMTHAKAKSIEINTYRNQMLKCVAKKPTDLHALHWLGYDHFTRSGNYVEAQKYFEKILDVYRNNNKMSAEVQRSLLYLAIIYQTKGETQQADDAYKRFLATNPDIKNDFILDKYQHEYLRNKGIVEDD